MWFPLALVALVMLVARRTVEKDLSGKIDSLALAWLQQAFALPFIFVTLFFAPFFMPGELSANFWFWTVLYSFGCAVDLYLYFKALSLAEVSYVAPLLALAGVTTVFGSVLILHQKPTLWGFGGAALVVAGTILVHRGKMKHVESRERNQLALWLILILVVLRASYSNFELWPLRESNPTTFNFYTSLLTLPMVLILTSILRRNQAKVYWAKTVKHMRSYIYPFLFIGLTYTINLTATYQAKLLSPTAGYVTAVKSAQVVPMVLIGAWLFREKVTKKQWYGVGLISLGLLGLGLG